MLVMYDLMETSGEHILSGKCIKCLINMCTVMTSRNIKFPFWDRTRNFEWRIKKNVGESDRDLL
jgi:hypothetical protein